MKSDLTRLRSRIAALEGGGGEVEHGAVPVDLPEMDAVLPWGGLALHGTSSTPPSRNGGKVSTVDRALALGALVKVCEPALDRPPLVQQLSMIKMLPM